jgi:predicted CoA-binding protein
MSDTIVTAGAYERLRLLNEHKTIAMVGLSPDPMRPSHFAAIYMIANGYEVIPVNPRADGTEILGQKVYASLSEIPQPVGIVDVFRRADQCVPIAEEAIAIGAKVFWLQLGVINDEAIRIAAEAGLETVQNRCVKIEHARFFGGLNSVGMNTGVISSKRAVSR